MNKRYSSLLSLALLPITINSGIAYAASGYVGSRAKKQKRAGTSSITKMLPKTADYYHSHTHKRQEIVFIDLSVKDYESLIKGIDPEIEVVFLESDRDGVKQIAAKLTQQRDLDAVHIISHGREGELHLGNVGLGNDNIRDYQQTLAEIGRAMSSTGDILLYGCDVAAAERGKEFVATLAEFTQADVAASVDATGSQGLGANWDLEIVSGNVFNSELLAAETKQNYSYTLAVNFKECQSIWDYSGSHNGAPSLARFGDIDGDGDQDLFLGFDMVNDRVYLNNGTGTFTDTGQEIAVYRTKNAWLVNVDGDPDLELVVHQFGSGGGDPVHVWDNDGSGNFSVKLATTEAANSVDLGDLDGDGDIDMFLGRYTVGDIVYKNDGSGGFSAFGSAIGHTSGEQARSLDVALLDIDGDSDLDVFVAQEDQGHAFKNDGSGNFGAAFLTFGDIYLTTLSTVDIDNDGDLDLFVAGDGVPGVGPDSNLYRNNQNSTLSLVQKLGDNYTIPIVFGDFDGDGDQDGFAGNSMWTNSGGVFTNTGPALEVTGQDGSSVAGAGDIDKDGDIDVLVEGTGYGYTADSKIFRNGTTCTPDIIGNIAPAFESGLADGIHTLAVNENSANTTAVYDVDANDGDGGTTDSNVTYSIISGNTNVDGDGNLPFAINGGSGAVTVNDSGDLDFESGTTSWDLEIQADDGEASNNTSTATLRVNLNNLNDNNPVITSNGGAATASIIVNENQTSVTTVTATDDDGNSVSYSLTGGVDQDKFAINSSSGVLSFTVAPNFESPTDTGDNNTYVVEVTATDNGTGALTDVQTITVTVDNINEAPVITSDGGGTAAAVNAAENQTAVTTVVASDQDVGDSLSYSLTGGADQAKFSIDPSSGVLTFVAAPDAETATDSDANGTYVVEVTATDDGTGTLSDVQTITVTVTSVNEAPMITSNGGGASAAVNAAENQTAVTTVVASDPDVGDSLTYSLTGGADQGKFSIDPSSGILTFVAAPDFESATDSDTNGTYVVEVTATDDGTGALSDEQIITVTVTNVNDSPMITSNGGGATAAVNAAENQTAVTTVVASDQDVGDSLSYSLTGGADQAKFSIDPSSGALSFLVAPDAETATDSDANGTYVVEVTATDDGTGLLTDVQTITVTVTSVNEAPMITSNGGGATAAVTAAENQTAVTTVVASDQDVGDSLSYSLTGGADQAKFSINPSSGVLSFLSAPDFETATDSDTNGTYVVEVTATDDGTGALSDVQTITVIVTNVNDAPMITSNGGGATAAVNAAENQTAVTTVVASDQDVGDSLSYSLTGGADQSKFSIDPSSGVLSFLVAPDAETKTDSDANGTYVVEVTATDDGTGTLSDEQTITVTVTSVNEAPMITSDGGGATAAVTAAENQTAVTTVVASDPDVGDSLTYSLTGGADQAKFNIDPSSGVLTFTAAPDFETATDSDANGTYVVEVTVTDNGTGALSDVQTITVTVDNVNDAPIITSDGGGATAAVNAAENQTAVTTVVASDPDVGDSLSYSLTGGADQAKFSIDPSSGALSFVAAPDAETATDSDSNGTYVVEVTVTDDGIGLLTDVQTITVTVTSVNEAPMITSDGGGAAAALNAAENQTAVTTVVASDADVGDSLSYSLTGGADQAKFSIEPSSGVLTFVAAPNFETATDSDTNGTYVVEVTATDNGTGPLSDVQSITVTVDNVNDAPVFTGIPTITGSTRVGGTLGLVDTDTYDEDGDTIVLSYQWEADGLDIPGAVFATCELTQNELLKNVSCRITADDGYGGVATVTTAAKKINDRFPWLLVAPGLVSPNKVMK